MKNLKKAVAGLLAVLVSVGGGYSLVACKKTDSLSLGYMENLMVDVEGTTAYSIRKETETSGAARASYQAGGESKKAAVSLLSASVVQEGVQPLAAKDKSHNYLYSTNESYEFGNVEYDETGITRVTFMKNKEVTGDVYDDNGNLIDAEREITQEELDSQINKIYTTREYTYLQFVAPVEGSGTYTYRTADGATGKEDVELRPEGMTYDENGVAEFDKGDYFTGELTASFVIDNETGYIYKIENLHILRFENGLLWAKSKNVESYFSIGTDENDNLVFTDVMPNKDVTVEGVFLDPYGWTYVLNNRVDEKISESKIIYTTRRADYLFDSEGNVYHNVGYSSEGDYFAAGEYSWGSSSGGFVSLCPMVDGIETWPVIGDYLNNAKYYNVAFDDNPIVRTVKYLTGEACVITGFYKNLAIYCTAIYGGTTIASGGYYPDYPDGKVPDSMLNSARIDVGLRISDYTSRPFASGHWLDENYDMLIVMSEDNRLCYAKVDLEACTKKQTTFKENKFERLSELPMYEAEEYYLSVGSDKYKINDVYYNAGLNETIYYRIVRKGKGLVLEELFSRSYTDNVFIFQPINK